MRTPSTLILPFEIAVEYDLHIQINKNLIYVLMLKSACFMYIFVPHEAEVDTNVTLSTSAYQYHTNYKCDCDNRYLLLYHN